MKFAPVHAEKYHFFFFYCALILWAKGADIWSIFVRVHLLNGRKLQVETEKAAE